MIIHPNQIHIVNNLFSPTEKELMDAQKLVRVFEEAEKKVMHLYVFKIS